MEVAPRYKLLTLFTLITIFSLFKLFALLTLLTVLTPFTMLTLLKQLWSKKAIMPIHGLIDLRALKISWSHGVVIL